MLNKVSNISQKVDEIIKKFTLLEMNYKNLETKLNYSLAKEDDLKKFIKNKDEEIEKLKDKLISLNSNYDEEKKIFEEKKRFFSVQINEYNEKIEDSIKKIDEIYSLIEKI